MGGSRDQLASSENGVIDFREKKRTASHDSKQMQMQFSEISHTCKSQLYFDKIFCDRLSRKRSYSGLLRLFTHECSTREINAFISIDFKNKFSKVTHFSLNFRIHHRLHSHCYTCHAICSEIRV